MARETWVQSQVESYQRLKKWYLMPPCLTLSIIRYRSRVKWSNPGKGVAPSPTLWCSKLSKRDPLGHPQLWSPTLLTYLHNKQSENGLSTLGNPDSCTLLRVVAILRWLYWAWELRIISLVRGYFLTRRIGYVTSLSYLSYLSILPLEQTIPWSSQN